MGANSFSTRSIHFADAPLRLLVVFFLLLSALMLPTRTASAAASYTPTTHWAVTVPPSLVWYTFAPASIVYKDVPANRTAQNYAATESGIIYYVDKTNGACSDSGTGLSPTLPFCKLSKGATTAVAGDTVRVLAGTYAETVTPNSGTAGNPVTFSAAPGVIVTGAPGNLDTGGAFRLISKSYIVVDGFTVTGSKDHGIYVSGSNHITISNNHVSYTGTPGSSSTARVGIFLNTTTYSTITGNTTDHNSSDGILLSSGSNYNLVSDNISFGNAYEAHRQAEGINLQGSSYNTILHNFTYANEDTGLNFFSGSSYNQVIGNVTYGNGDHGIDNNNSPNNTIIGNSVHGNVTVGINIEGEPSPGSGGATVRNNIMMDNGLLRQDDGSTSTGYEGNIEVDPRSWVGTTLDYNLYYLTPAEGGTVQVIWNGNSYSSLTAFRNAVPGQETHGLVGNPLFTSPAPIAVRPHTAPYKVAVNVGDYHINAGSPAIDSANADAPNEPLQDIEGNDRVDDPDVANTGAGVRTYDDRGAYEFQGACFILTITPGVNGSTPTANPPKSAVCTTAGRYIHGEVITLTAVPDAGYMVASWTGTDNDASTSTINTVTMPAGTRTVSVNYILDVLTHVTITGNAGVGGAVLSYTDGTPQTVTADGLGGYTITVPNNWSGIVTPSLAGYTFSPTNRVYTNVQANQTAQDYSATPITFTISGNAGVAGVTISFTGGTPATAGIGGAYAITVPYNWSGTVTPSLTGYTFNPISRSYTNVLANRIDENYTATQNEYTLTVTSAHGTVVKNPAQTTYHYGAVVQLTTTPDAGWSFANWTGDASGTANPVSLTIDGNKAVTANYTQIEYTLTVTSAHGTVVKNPAQTTYHYGAVVQLTATPDAGWNFANWTGDASGTANPVSVTINGNKAVTANYTQIEYTLTVTSAHGTVVKNPAQTTYHYGAVVQLTATPDAGWSFANWTGDASGTANPVSVTIDGNKAVTANYTQIEYTLTVTSVHGTVVKNPAQTTYHYGAVVQLTASPDAGWSFANWTGDASGTANPVSVTINGNKAVTANYTQNEYTLTVTSAHGTVVKNPAQTTYHYGAVVQLTATPDAGWSFTNWTGDASGTANPVSLTIDGNKAVTANYTQIEYTLTVTSAHGTVVKNPAQTTYHYGAVVQLTATADAGWSFANWTGDASGTANPVSVTIDGNKAVTANYTQIEYTLTVTSAHGTVVKNPAQTTYHYGAVVQLTATPDAGWSFASWTGDASGTTNPVSVTIDGNKAVTANYTQNEYTLTVTSAHGTVVKNPAQTTYHYGAVVQLSAAADAGWSFANWTGDASGTANPVSVTIDGNKAVTANYTQIEYTLTVTSAHGTVVKNPAQTTYHYGAVVQLSAAADAGWSFANWTGDASGTANPVSVTIDGNKAVTANYTQIEYTLTVTSAHGTVVKNPAQTTYHYGAVVQLTATPDAGWSFANWTGDASGTANPVSVTIDGNKAVTANYTQNEYTLTVTSAHGTVVKNPAQTTYHYGAVVQLTATPDAGWSFANWTGDASGTANPVSVTIDGNKAVTANYTQNEYTLTVTSAHGTVVKDPDQETYHYGDFVQLTATADAGWSFANWTGDASGTANPVSVTIDGNKAVTANYTQNEYTLTVTSAHGTVVKDPDQETYHYGDFVQLTATADAGWSFASWTGDASGTANPVSLTIDGNKAVTANFIQYYYFLPFIMKN